MKKIILIFALCVSSSVSLAAICPNNHQYEELQSYALPDNKKETQELINKMTEDLKKSKFPNTYIHCDVRDHKYLYCAACKKS